MYYPNVYVGLVYLLLYVPENGDLSPKHEAEFMCMDGL
jgi:hypothetical protein